MKVDIHDRKHQLALAGAGTALLASGWLLRRHLRNKIRRGPLTPETLPKDAYDAVIVGAGKVVCMFLGLCASVHGRDRKAVTHHTVPLLC